MRKWIFHFSMNIGQWTWTHSSSNALFNVYYQSQKHQSWLGSKNEHEFANVNHIKVRETDSDLPISIYLPILVFVLLPWLCWCIMTWTITIFGCSHSKTSEHVIFFPSLRSTWIVIVSCSNKFQWYQNLKRLYWFMGIECNTFILDLPTLSTGSPHSAH